MHSFIPLRRIPLNNACNVRELGGYPTQDGRVTQWKRFLRGDDQSALSASDIQVLKDYGVKAVIDLRSDDEIAHRPDVMEADPAIDYHHVSFMVGDIDDATVKLTQSDSGYTLGDFYVQLLDQRKDIVKDLIDYIGNQAPQGTILFHCAAGKDRTGTLAMLLLMIAGVAVQDIEANYQVTESYILNDHRFMNAIAADYPISMDDIPPEMLSTAKTIRRAYDYVANNYASIDVYLASCKISQSTVDHVRDRLLQ